jgi:hypothetical protein
MHCWLFLSLLGMGRNLTHRKSTRNSSARAALAPSDLVPAPKLFLPAAERHALGAYKAYLAAYDQRERDTQRVVNHLRSLPPKECSIPAALCRLDLKHLDCTTIWRCLSHDSRPGHTAQEKNKLLPLSTKWVLAEWIKWRGREGLGYDRKTIQARAMELGGLTKVPGRKWMGNFERRHPDIDLNSPRALDPKQSKAFNPSVVKGHFENLAEAMEGVKLCLIANWDEAGVQHSGGQTCLNRHVAFAADDKSRYQHRSDNLELTTILDAVCADGHCLVPGFVFSGKSSYEDSWFNNKWVL